MVLVSAKEDDLDKLASLADRVAEVTTPSVSVIETSQLSAEVEQRGWNNWPRAEVEQRGWNNWPQVLGCEVSFFHLIFACM